jgi:hypothetical protein
MAGTFQSFLRGVGFTLCFIRWSSSCTFAMTMPGSDFGERLTPESDQHHLLYFIGQRCEVFPEIAADQTSMRDSSHLGYGSHRHRSETKEPAVFCCRPRNRAAKYEAAISS